MSHSKNISCLKAQLFSAKLNSTWTDNTCARQWRTFLTERHSGIAIMHYDRFTIFPSSFKGTLCHIQQERLFLFTQKEFYAIRELFLFRKHWKTAQDEGINNKSHVWTAQL